MYRKIESSEVVTDKRLNGYLYFVDKSHPLAYKACGRVYLHRHVASIKVGRWLSSEDIVHHIDEDKENNNPSNLEVITRAQHCIEHFGEAILATCLACGIEFKLPHPDRSKYCSVKCSTIGRTKDIGISKESLQELINSGETWVSIGRRFNMSDNGIRKRAKNMGCVIPIRRKT